MESTQILFNSPALHSLRREQLVKLCKHHQLKANGKNQDMILRLQQHALDLQARGKAGPGIDYQPSDDEDASNRAGKQSADTSEAPSRPSEQWEIVMERIEEVDEHSQSLPRSTNPRTKAQGSVGEFGTASSKASGSSLTSSIKSIANSLGFTRSTSGQHPYALASTPSEAARPRSNSQPAPIPGHANLPGLPAPEDARLSLSDAAETTTIRLVGSKSSHPPPSTTSVPLPMPNPPPNWMCSPPKLKPFATTFEILPPSPATGGMTGTFWATSPRKAPALYPPIPSLDFDDAGSKSIADMDVDDEDDPADIPGGMRASPSPVGKKPTARPSIPPAFVFGSPDPKHRISNAQFSAAAQTVLAEMNARLQQEGTATVSSNLLQDFKANGPSAASSTNAAAPAGPSEVRVKFDKVHDGAFAKMDSIATHYAARRAAASSFAPTSLSKKRKSTVLEDADVPAGAKKKAALNPAAARRVGATTSSSSSTATATVRKPQIPGGLGEADEDGNDDEASREANGDAEEPDRQSKRMKLGAADEHKVKKKGAEEDEARKEREREAIRRRLEHNRQKRRNSVGRPGLGKTAQSPKPASRFGLLSTAKSLVKSVWNRGTASKPVPSKPTASSSSSTSSKGGVTATTAASLSRTRTQEVAASTSSKKSSVPPSATKLKQTLPSTNSTTKPRVASGSIGRSRPPIPSFAKSPTPAPYARAKSKSPLPGSAPARARSNSATLENQAKSTSATAASRARSHTVNSMGMVTKHETARTPSMDVIPESKRVVSGSGSSVNSIAATTTRTRTVSRLFTPTASSLAKQQSNSMSKVPTHSPAKDRPGVTRGTNSLSKLPVFSPTPLNVPKKAGTSRLPSSNSPLKVGAAATAKSTSGTALDPITNVPSSPRKGQGEAQGKIFSTPLVASHIPVRSRSVTPVPPPATPRPADGSPWKYAALGPRTTPKPPLPPKPKVLPGRRPRISRSKVITKLASQRDGASAAPSGAGAGVAARHSLAASISSRSSGKTRSSLSVDLKAGGTGAGGSDVLASARKRARRSEYARRRSRVGAGDEIDMDVDG